ncbi:DNA repair protein RecN [Prevotella sp. E9-3]|uniref:DNA repair protein RecN n=1 Tax=Prevotella sp. E9-3 TaxID=2913621 RepID=UPI001EDB4C91|nr:DNA repair protein RecN [Prevotella sp. E9-3]UKK49446.1 DNA repair protein RecN [Prevotella sp. E9-3]
MLKHLFIKNYTLIDELDIEFREGFSVITGETGAGKSIILGAIGLLLGQRAESKTIKQGAEKCIVEAHFDLSRYDLAVFFEQNDIEFDATDTIVRRELTVAGKSRAFINDTPVSLVQMKELGEQLIDVHSQHQNLLLGKHDFQLQVVDIIANDEKELSAYQQSFQAFRATEQQLKALQEEIEQGQKEADFLQFQYDELSSAHLVADEQEELEAKSDTMTHAEDIKQALYETDSALSNDDTGVIQALRRSASSLNSIKNVLAPVAELAERVESTYVELKDVAAEVSDLLENIDFDPSELDAVNLRLDKIYELQKKYHVESVVELLTIQDNLQQRLSNIENSDEAVAELQQKQNVLKEECAKKADALTLKREKAAREIEKQMCKRLVPLGMPNVRFQISVERDELSRNGQDKVSFLFSANTSTALQSVALVASGGEIARVMLSLKAMVSGAVKLPTIIFDEIDTGVSGKIAEQMARIMYEMGMQNRQVISITHLPQIAALGTTHYKVYKEETPQGTTSHMQMLDESQRVSELAQMLSGSNITEAAMENARQLLGQR